MRWDNLYLAGVGTYLPEGVETAEEAIAAGRYTERARRADGYRRVRIAAPGQTGPTMAVAAARRALARAEAAVDDFALVLHSYIGHQGLDLWTPASYVQRETVGGRAPAFEIKQGCNGLLSGIELAASYLAAHSGPAAALVSGGDAFRLPYIDRWHSHAQLVRGDGAGAAVLSTRRGFARVLATCSLGDASLEPLGRTGTQWSDAPFAEGRTVETADAAQKAAGELDLETAIERISAGVCDSVKLALHDAGADLADVRFFLHQNLGESFVVHGIHLLLGLDRGATAYDEGLDLGLVSTVDPLIGLEQVISRRDPRPGDLAVLQAVGAGYVWTVVVLEFLRVPGRTG